jgi:hypothetical protein
MKDEMKDEGEMRQAGTEPAKGPAPLQFSILAALGVMTAFAVLFAALSASGVSRMTSLVVTGLVVASLAAAFGLVIAIASSGDRRG